MVQPNGTGFGRDQSINGGVIMAGYWLKLYTEILDDPKYNRVSDNAKLGMIELMVVAKKVGMDGGLPGINDVAFYTRRTIEWWKPVFDELQEIEYLVVNNDETTIRKFAERQAPVSDAERMKQTRAKKHKEETNNNGANTSYEVATKRNGDSDTDTDIDTENKELLPEPELEPCDIDGVPDSWKDKPQRKQFISLEEKRLGDTISDLLGIKPPLLQGKRDYAASMVTWWKPIREMLRQVDGDVSKAERTVEKALDKLRGRDYVISSPQGLEKTYISCLVSIRDKGFEPTKQDSDLYDIINR